MTLQELLQPFRDQDGGRRFVVSVIAGDLDAQRCLTTWTTYPIGWSAHGEPPQDERRRWEWLCRGVEIDLDDFAERAGIAPAVTESKLNMLLSNRLAFPDGTLSQWVEPAIGGVIEPRRGRAKPPPVVAS